MRIRERWQHFWSQRPPWRVRAAWLGVLVAVVVGALGLIPVSLWEQAGVIGNDVVAWITELGSRAIFLVAGITLLVFSIAFALAPRRRVPAYLSNRLSAIAKTSVYVDAENQATSPQKAKSFVSALRTELAGRPADLIYYGDSMRVARSSLQNPKDHKAQERYHAFRVLYRFGFRPVDVFHKTFGVNPEKNVVDVELALHAYQRALIGPEHQEIHLVTADGDFVPLVYRLKAMGHTLHLWADAGEPISTALTALPEYLDVETHRFGEALPGMSSSSTQATPHTDAHQQVPEETDAVSEATVDLPLPNERAIATLERAISATLQWLNASFILSQTPEVRQLALRNWLNGEGRASIEPLAYPIKDAGAYWIAHLKAFGILQGGNGAAPLTPSSLIPHDAAVRIERVLCVVSHIAKRLANESLQAEIKLNMLGQRLDKSPLIAAEDMPRHLHALLSDANHLITNIRCFVWCARALGLLQFREQKNLNLVLVLPDVAEPTPPQ